MKKIIKIFSAILAVIMVLSSTSVAFAYTQTYSKYDDKTYTHNTRFDALPKVIGIDVSEHNKTIDFNKVKADGIDFVYVRVGYTGYTKSKLSLNLDPYYQTNIANALAAGLQVGVYWYSQAVNESEASQEANMLLNAIAGYNVTLPVVDDYEFAGVGDNGRLDSANLSKDQMTANSLAFLNTVAQRGYVPCLYANKSFLENRVNASQIAQIAKIWLAHYNTVTGWAYAVNGVTGNLTAIPMKNKNAVDKIALLDGKNINIKEIVENNYKGFSYGDMTSVAVSPNGEKLAVAIQSSDYSAAGCLAVFLCGADGTLSFDQIYEAGVQPDMVTFTPDSKKILSADEGEPRNGYEAGSIDPKGTVTVIDLTNQNVSHLDFTVFDSEAKRAELVQNGVILKKGTAPSVDLEPEYIAANDKTAYVTLQEANAIAIVDLQTLSIENICSAGYEDYEKYPIDIDKKDAAYRPVSYPSLRGIRMPDGISLFESNGKTYIVTANEGDSREWNEYLNEAECNFGKGQTSPSGKITAENSGLTGKVVFFDQNDYEGLNSEYDYLFGGRSFTVYCVDGSGMKEVYTSGNELEAKTAAYFPQYFNCSNDSAEIDDRSGKKGVEAESVTIGTVGEKTYAFIGLERIGGVMAYDITNPDKILFANYINSRDFSKDIAGDVSPEGLCMISASESADGNAYLLASCEVSGTVAAYKLISQNIDSSDDDNTDNNHDNNIDHNGSGHGGADTEDLNNQESKTNALKTGDHAPVIGTGIGMVLALSAIIVILKYRRSKNTITNTK